MEKDNEQEKYAWEVMNLKHPTIAQRNEENFKFLKDKYWELILHFIKKGDTKSVAELQKGWEEIKIQYKS